MIQMYSRECHSCLIQNWDHLKNGKQGDDILDNDPTFSWDQLCWLSGYGSFREDQEVDQAK